MSYECLDGFHVFFGAHNVQLVAVLKHDVAVGNYEFIATEYGGANEVTPQEVAHFLHVFAHERVVGYKERHRVRLCVCVVVVLLFEVFVFLFQIHVAYISYDHRGTYYSEHAERVCTGVSVGYLRYGAVKRG